MEGFKKPTKMQCFKEGGSVKYESRKEHKEEVSADIAQDKKVVKKAFAMHDKQEHPGEKTDLSKLKKGGRAKRSEASVRKYKTGGTVENQYAAKKSDKDLKDIANTKRQKPQMLCGGKSVRKYADGGGVLDSIGSAIGGAATQLKNNVMGTPEQNRIAQEQMDKIKRKKAMQAAAAAGGLGAGAGAMAAPAMPAPPAPPGAGVAPPAAAPSAPDMSDAMGQGAPLPAQKRGGKVKGKK
jgi:hypothetical protein